MQPAPEALVVTPALDAVGEWLWPAARELPPAVVARTRRLWLDTAACAFAGLRAAELTRWLALQAEGDAGRVPLPGLATPLSASAAATAFAVGACWDEACEGVALAHGRPGVPVVAALWAQLAVHDATWDQLWRATAVGYEIGARLGARLRIKPGMHVDGVWSAFGAAAAVVFLRGGDWACARRAIEACAAQLPFSLYRPIRQGATIRNLYLGHSAWLGLQAAQAALSDWTMPAGCLDDVLALALDGGQGAVLPGPGDWLVLQSYWKPFAAVRHVHYGAQASLRLRAALPAGVVPDEMRLTVYPEALQYCPNRAPATAIAAQFSLTWGLAAAWIHGALSPAEFRGDRFADERVRRLEQRIVVEVDAQAFPPPARGARLFVRLGDRSWTVEQGAVTGDAGLQPDESQVLAKFSQFTGADAAMAQWADRVRTDPSRAAACLPRPGA
ncbi:MULTISPECIES: MmgE/PrpD family protein [Ramlibacter]|uniref:MmgE/PrpD family protein n=1 Tax=Ramlibacter pinisoli TaxID=2682844 RepID=A0A6N8ITQ3_9BURK|nr:MULTISPECIES: MmgE/PrpD family protein [Ramlibacter]MBA2965347.1 MmgE/PrpD family protein [Ramlibacter sp. CGMCC 1.13660]MVQ30311.1 MmgE/PrpD family protein [Ramlibacter pinisoli]